MPSDFAVGLTEQLCRFLSIPISNEEQLDFANAIDFHARYLGEANREDLASVLFLECAEEAEKRKVIGVHVGFQLVDMRRLLSRVQKRLYRDARIRAETSGELIQSHPSTNRVDASVIERILRDFQTYVSNVLSPRDGMIFESRFIRGKSIPEICEETGTEKSTVYERIRAIKQVFTGFLADVGHPDFHDT